MSGPPPTPTIRLATDLDAGRISGLVSQLARDHITGAYSPPARDRLLASMSADRVRRSLSEGFEYHVAEVDDELVGVVATRDDAHLYHLFVADAWQGRGLGRRLWELARERCAERSGRRRFTVNSSANAVGVYERFGFVREGPMRDEDGVRFQPMVLEERD